MRGGNPTEGECNQQFADSLRETGRPVTPDTNAHCKKIKIKQIMQQKDPELYEVFTKTYNEPENLNDADLTDLKWINAQGQFSMGAALAWITKFLKRAKENELQTGAYKLEYSALIAGMNST
jgi:hypothetical protein